jgi:CYTH domain-containing protein
VLTTICVDPNIVEIRPATGTDLDAHGFLGVYLDTNEDGTIRVQIAGKAPDLTQAVFLRGMTRAEFEASMK